MRRFVLLLALGLTACSHDDPTFGRSYDACVLKHGSSDTAKEICQRHFTRSPTQAEKDEFRKISYVELKLNQPGDIMSNDKPWDNIDIIVPNSASDDVVVTSVRVTATFYTDTEKTKPMAKMPLVWDDFPYDSASVGRFEGNKAPSPYMNATVEPTKVYSHSGQ